MMPAYPVTVNRQAGTTSRLAPVAKAAQNEAPPSDEEISKLREQQLAIALDNVRHDAQKSLIQILVILLVSIPLFIIHWRFSQKLDAAEST